MHMGRESSFLAIPPVTARAFSKKQPLYLSVVFFINTKKQWVTADSTDTPSDRGGIDLFTTLPLLEVPLVKFVCINDALCLSRHGHVYSKEDLTLTVPT
ncbi:MAG: hypothetical protein ABFS08_13235 [Pseudomonadota bacterium]